LDLANWEYYTAVLRHFKFPDASGELLGRVNDLDVIEEKDRKLSQGKKITVYKIHPEKVQQVSLNYRVK
jgi:hypothetical protein